LKVEHSPAKTQLFNVSLTPGQMLFSRRIAAEETGLSENVIRACIKILEERRTIKVTKHFTNQISILTVLNWQAYQNDDRQNHQVDHRADNQAAAKNDASVSLLSPRARAPAELVVKEVSKKTTHADLFFSELEPQYQNRIDIFEATLSPSYEAVLELYRTRCREAGRGFARDLNTRAGAQILALEIDRGNVTLEAVGSAMKAIMSDPEKRNWGLRGIAANFGNHTPPPASAKQGDDKILISWLCDKCGRERQEARPRDQVQYASAWLNCDVPGCGGIFWAITPKRLSLEAEERRKLIQERRRKDMTLQEQSA
jgi:hypothetical protein